MNRSFKFQRKDKSSFEIKEENLKQIEMPNVIKEPVRVVEDTQTGYEDNRWVEKSNRIKARDNYTCQLCHTFNPMQGEFVFIKQGEFDTFHHYYWKGTNIYEIYVKGYILTITFNFMPNFHLAMPRLNVHHKIYYKNRKLWDYNDDCLVTLCENCHHYVHSLKDIGIPIVEENANGQSILIGKTQPKPYKPRLDHTDLGSFYPLALVEENIWGMGLKGQDLADYQRIKGANKQWYDYHKIFIKAKSLA